MQGSFESAVRQITYGKVAKSFQGMATHEFKTAGKTKAY